MNLKRRRFRLIYINKLKNNEINKQNICKIKKKKGHQQPKNKIYSNKRKPKLQTRKIMYKKRTRKIREPTNSTCNGIICNSCIFNQICIIKNERERKENKMERQVYAE